MLKHRLRHAQVRLQQDSVEGIIKANLRLSQVARIHLVGLCMHLAFKSNQKFNACAIKTRSEVKQVCVFPIPGSLQSSRVRSELRWHSRAVSTQRHQQEETSFLVVTQRQRHH